MSIIFNSDEKLDEKMKDRKKIAKRNLTCANTGNIVEVGMHATLDICVVCGLEYGANFNQCAFTAALFSPLSN